MIILIIAQDLSILDAKLQAKKETTTPQYLCHRVLYLSSYHSKCETIDQRTKPLDQCIPAKWYNILQLHKGTLYFACDIYQGPTLTFEGTCPFGQSDPKIYLPEKKFNLPPKMLFCTLFIINTVTSYFV